MGRVRSPKRRVRDDDFIVGYPRMWSDYRRIVFLLAEAFQGFSPQILTFKISWQAQYLVRLEGDLTGSAHWKWRFKCDADHWWHWFCVAGAVFGEVGGSFCVAGAVFGEVGGRLFVTGAVLRDILGDSRDAKCCILQYKIGSQMGRVRSPKRRVRDDDFIVGYRRISSDVVGLSSNRLSIGGSIQGVSAEILSFKNAWQAQCLVRLDVDFTASTHWKWGCICEADHWWLAFCVAGAVFGEVAECLCLLRAFEMRLHMWRRSLMTCILRGRRRIWWGCRVSLLAPHIGNDVWYVRQITGDIHFVWQAQQLLKLQAASCCSAHWKWRFICDADHWCLAFCEAGAVFGEVAGCLSLLPALEMTFST